jgi:hypothetical protein
MGILARTLIACGKNNTPFPIDRVQVLLEIGVKNLPK